MSIACISSVFSVHTCLEYMGPNRREGEGGSKTGLIEGLPVCLPDSSEFPRGNEEARVLMG